MFVHVRSCVWLGYNGDFTLSAKSSFGPSRLNQYKLIELHPGGSFKPAGAATSDSSIAISDSRDCHNTAGNRSRDPNAGHDSLTRGALPQVP